MDVYVDKSRVKVDPSSSERATLEKAEEVEEIDEREETRVTLTYQGGTWAPDFGPSTHHRHDKRKWY